MQQEKIDFSVLYTSTCSFGLFGNRNLLKTTRATSIKGATIPIRIAIGGEQDTIAPEAATDLPDHGRAHQHARQSAELPAPSVHDRQPPVPGRHTHPRSLRRSGLRGVGPRVSLGIADEQVPRNSVAIRAGVQVLSLSRTLPWRRGQQQRREQGFDNNVQQDGISPLQGTRRDRTGAVGLRPNVVASECELPAPSEESRISQRLEFAGEDRQAVRACH